jgi:hypothetical protein
VVALWSRVLAAVPASTLLLKSSPLADEGTRALVAQRFAAHGVGPERLRLAGEEPTVRRHLERYAEVDIALDPFPYNGATTTCEALWMGVPVVSLAAAGMAGRLSASLLASAGCGAWIANSEDDYIRIARSLAQGGPRQQAQRLALREQVAASPMANAQRLTRALESCYQTERARIGAV